MKIINLSYRISISNQDVDMITFSDDISYDVAETATFPFPTTLAALYSTSQVPYDFDDTSTNGEVTLHIDVKATFGDACETIEVCDTVTSTVDAVVALYSALNLAAEKLLPGAGGRLA